VQLLGVWEVAEVANIGVYLSGLVYVESSQVPCRPAGDFAFAYRVLVAVGLVL